MSTSMKRVKTLEKPSFVVEQEVPVQTKQTSGTTLRKPIEVTQPITRPPPRRVQSYEPEPLFTTTTMFSFGTAVIILASIWTPLALLFVWACARLQRYWFRLNDVACTRRRLLKDFQRIDQRTAPMRAIPKGMKVEESYWVNRRGMSLMTNILLPDNDQPIKAVVCYCHGYSDFPTLTRRNEFVRMVKKGIAVVMLEYEGHGRSDGTLGLITDWDKLIDDTSDFFEQTVRRRFSSIPTFLMGESMGGAVAYCTYNRNPKLFKGVVFVCPMCKIGDGCLPSQWVIDLFRQLAGPKGTASTLGYLPIAPSQGIEVDWTIRPHKQETLCSFPLEYARKPRLATARELLDVTIHISNDLKNFTAPFLVQHGSLDRVTDPKLSQALYEDAVSTDKTMKLYDGMLHSLLSGEFDENIDVVFKDSIDWVLERADVKTD
eukprot:Nitzschia sp. Nitz4//scaffold40_size135432//73440//74822//NITZ4_003249-RA/size135432-snap-gene-0.128-mRNA-1//-1//CDS//3329551234//7665//frame0